jgi:hypothetical protein
VVQHHHDREEGAQPVDVVRARPRRAPRRRRRRCCRLLLRRRLLSAVRHGRRCRLRCRLVQQDIILLRAGLPAAAAAPSARNVTRAVGRVHVGGVAAVVRLVQAGVRLQHYPAVRRAWLFWVR